MGQNEQQKGTVSVAWTRSCCASLPGLRNRFWQCPHKCTVTTADAEVEPAVLDCPSDALPEAMPSSNCRGGCVDTATAVFSAATAAVPAGLRFARGSCDSIDDRLRVCCFGGDLPLASIAVRMCVGIGWGEVKERMTFQNHNFPTSILGRSSPTPRDPSPPAARPLP